MYATQTGVGRALRTTATRCRSSHSSSRRHTFASTDLGAGAGACSSEATIIDGTALSNAILRALSRRTSLLRSNIRMKSPFISSSHLLQSTSQAAAVSTATTTPTASTSAPPTTSSQLHSHTPPHHRPPHLSVILANSSRDSSRYVSKKRETAESIGVDSITHLLDESNVTLEEMLRKIDKLNQDDDVDGILVQLPLPNHLSQYESVILSRVSPSKDVDGFHPLNLGQLALEKEQDAPLTAEIHTPVHHQIITPVAEHIHHIPCTPKAVMQMLASYEIPLAGKNVVVLGRSTTVGLPLTLLMLKQNATVTNISHQTPVDEARRICQTADVIIAAVGQPEYIRADWIKHGCAIIDVGINFIPGSYHRSNATTHANTATPSSYTPPPPNPADIRDNLRLVGDVHFDGCRSKAGFISPVPGGVGPMTVAMLMENTISSYQHRLSKLVQLQDEIEEQRGRQ